MNHRLLYSEHTHTFVSFLKVESSGVLKQLAVARSQVGITSAISAGMKKYKKYYELMDAQDAYYTALVLDPRFKTLLLDKGLGVVVAPL